MHHKKILIVTSKYLPAIGGLEIAADEISREFVREGHEVRVIANRHKRTLPAREIVNGISVRRLYFTHEAPRVRNLWIWFKYFVRLCFAPVSLLSLIREIQQFKPDVVHFHYIGSPALYLWLAHKLLSFRLIVTAHAEEAEDLRLKPRSEQFAFRKILEAADGVTAGAENPLKALIAEMPEIKKKALVVSMAFSPELIDAAQPPAHSSPYIFSARRFCPEKGQDILIRAFAELISQEQFSGDLILAGDGEELAACQKLAQELQVSDRVQFRGALTREQTAALMKGCELFVVPSRSEAFGIVILEALYSGAKVIASKVGGIPELMKNNPDCLAEPDNSAALAKKISDLFSQKIKWNAVDPNKLRADYSWQRTADRFLKIYQETANEHEGKRSKVSANKNLDEVSRGTNGNLFSVLICTYNRSELLRGALEALIEGTQEKPDEVIAVNGGAAEADLIIDSFNGKCGVPVKKIRTVNKNLAASRNLGLKYCTGSIVAMTDDDARVSSDWVTQMKRVHKEHPEAGAVGGKVLGLDSHSIAAKAADLITFPAPAQAGFVEMIPGVNISFKKEALEKLGDQDETLVRGEDEDFNHRLLQLNWKIYYDPEIRVYHIHRPSLGGFLRQHFDYGKSYYQLRLKWPDLYAVYPRKSSGWKAPLKGLNFFLGIFYGPLLAGIESGDFLRSLPALPAVFLAQVVWRAGMISEKLTPHSGSKVYTFKTKAYV